jgi:hypothetical protein
LRENTWSAYKHVICKLQNAGSRKGRGDKGIQSACFAFSILGSRALTLSLINYIKTCRQFSA